MVRVATFFAMSFGAFVFWQSMEKVHVWFALRQDEKGEKQFGSRKCVLTSFFNPEVNFEHGSPSRVGKRQSPTIVLASIYWKELVVSMQNYLSEFIYSDIYRCNGLVLCMGLLLLGSSIAPLCGFSLLIRTEVGWKRLFYICVDAEMILSSFWQQERLDKEMEIKRLREEFLAQAEHSSRHAIEFSMLDAISDFDTYDNTQIKYLASRHAIEFSMLDAISDFDT
ncbi:hypothetical protein ZIOFF_052270 [Zingiber officinale]|uniref:Uncharacterized protein n=1 Tax=Zingiber officinale TaxID=94328 RepID=A0A8J5KVA4_ZINOF|nr:hypothetical protein ZIOFF_052270 [Zingiber officinale]